MENKMEESRLLLSIVGSLAVIGFMALLGGVLSFMDGIMHTGLVPLITIALTIFFYVSIRLPGVD